MIYLSADNSDEDPARCNAETAESPCSGELMFACNSGMCVLKAFVCDDSEDCDDGSDEVGCGKFKSRLLNSQ